MLRRAGGVALASRSLSSFVRRAAPVVRLARSVSDLAEESARIDAAIKDLRERQQPFKAQFKDKESSRVVGRASGYVLPVGEGDVGVFLKREPSQKTEGDYTFAGLHKMGGGDGSALCSVDLMLQSLVGCAGTTLKAVSTTMRVVYDRCDITAEADQDFRGTLAVHRQVPVGVLQVRLHFAFRTVESIQRGHVFGTREWSKLLELTERYCIVAQTLKHGVLGHEALKPDGTAGPPIASRPTPKDGLLVTYSVISSATPVTPDF